jgi:hypothetical protein
MSLTPITHEEIARWRKLNPALLDETWIEICDRVSALLDLRTKEINMRAVDVLMEIGQWDDSCGDMGIGLPNDLRKLLDEALEGR